MLCLNLNKKITGKTADGGTNDVEIMVPLKYSNNFWKTLEINLILTWSHKFVLSNDVKATTFAITDTKLYQLKIMENKQSQQLN